MEEIIDNINNTKDLKKLNYNKKYQLSDEIRKYIIEVVSENSSGLILMIKGSKIALNKGMANKIIVQ